MRVTTHIALIEPHPVLRCGLKAVLDREPGLEVVGQVGDLRSAHELIADARPSVVITEAILPDGDGIAMAAEIERSDDGARALILTAQTEPLFFLRARRLGISGYALKAQPAAEIVDAVRALCHGETYAPRDLAHLVAARHVGADPISATPFNEPSEREDEIVGLIRAGRTNAAIARAMSTGAGALEIHPSQTSRN
jgi:DNA-binding NarL/FixJ family response regulator